MGRRSGRRSRRCSAPQHTFDSSGHAFVTLLLAVGFATGLVAAYRVLVQKRPLTGPGRTPLPRSGLGIAKMRGRLDQLGIDPDKIHTVGARPEPPAELDARRRGRPAREAP